jgi:hypothetical protein
MVITDNCTSVWYFWLGNVLKDIIMIARNNVVNLSTSASYVVPQIHPHGVRSRDFFISDMSNQLPEEILLRLLQVNTQNRKHALSLCLYLTVLC